VTITIQEAKARHAAQLLAVPGVVSVGIGRDEAGQAVIVVGVVQKDPETLAKLPSTLDGHPVDVRAVGRIRAQ
jgi:hypothetical protein